MKNIKGKLIAGGVTIATAGIAYIVGKKKIDEKVIQFIKDKKECKECKEETANDEFEEEVEEVEEVETTTETTI